MKKIIFIIILFTCISCNNNCFMNDYPFTGEDIKVDTVFVVDTVYIDKIDSIYFENTHKIDSLEQELVYANFKLERIRYYNDIAKNGNNIKYLRGWINRTLND